MYLTEKIAINIGIRSRTILNIDETREKVVIYGAMSLLQIIWGVTWTSGISLIFGVFYEALLFSVIVSILRKYSGGVHASSPSRCVAIGTFIATGFGLLIDKFLCSINIFTVGILGIICVLVSLIIVIKKSPVDSIKKPINNIELKQRFKSCSIIIVFIYLITIIAILWLYKLNSNLWYIKAIECISLGSLWQSITLTGNGAKILNKLDAVLKYIFERR
ncbi:MAG: accessory gene regulator B family protein [Clostridium sp.]|nr:accessory gene regulator B family protein [Clostridium sp.]